MIRALCLSVLVIWAPVLVAADARIMRIYDLLELDVYVEIARTEGLADAGNISQDMLGRPADAGFIDQMEQVYDIARMRETVTAPLGDLTAAELEAVIAFFQTDAAFQITEFEVAARRAMADEDVEQSARLAWVEAATERPDLVAQIKAITEVNDLVERNVAGALNSNLRYYQGLSDGDALDLTEDEILAQVWGQEEDVRADTEEWLGGYFLLAYDPLSPGDLDAYLEFWKSPAGTALNAAIFDGFNQVYDDVSYATGRVVALHMGSEDL